MQPQARLPVWFLVANMLLVLAAFLAGALLTGARGGSLPDAQATALRLVYDAVQKHHVEAQDPALLAERAIAGMVRGLDPYSQYIPPQHVKGFEEDTTGTYEGIGVLTSTMAEGGIVVRYPFPQGPAEKAGLTVGDRIVAVDGTALAGLGAAERSRVIGERLRGPAGSDVTVTIARQGREPFPVTVTRGPVQKPSVKWARLLDPAAGVGCLHVEDFHRDTAREFAAAVADLQAQGDGLRALIVDLRGNGGGLLDECLGLARQLVPSGNIVSMKRRGSEVVERHDAIPGQCTLPDLPLVLLVNGHSASASEVLAGALQDHGRAVVVGERTFGKGFVNTIYTWQGLPFRLKLTTAHYYTPNGRNIERPHGRAAAGAPDEGGILPDLPVATDAELRERIELALRDHEVPARYRAASAALARELGLTEAAPLGPDQDPQLDAALAEARRRAGPTGGSGR